MKATKPKISHYELLVRACDQAKASFERALTKEASAKHFLKTSPSSDLPKSEIKILKLEFEKTQLRRKSKKIALKIAALRLKVWAKKHDVEEKIYELSDNGETVETPSIKDDPFSPTDSKKNRKAAKAKSTGSTETKASKKQDKAAKIKTVEAVEAAAPKKRGPAPKPKAEVVEAAAPKKRGPAPKPKVEVVEAAAPRKRGPAPKPKAEAVEAAAPKRRGPAPKPKAEVVEAVAPKKPGKVAKVKSVEVVSPPKAPKAAASQPNDFTLLEGVGAKVNQILMSANIMNFSQLANTDEEVLRKILYDQKFRFLNPTILISQAKLAAAGKMAELEKMKTDLKLNKKK
jgi:predicted flap endonuclease-1-like 5' DNA nuclease